VPQQGPRALVGHQGGRGARLNPVRRLTLTGAFVIAGGAVVAIGSRLAWATVTINPSTVSAPGLPRAAIAGGKLSLDSSAVQAGYLFGLGLLLALVPLGWLVAGPRGRLVLGVVGFAVAAIVFWQAEGTRGHIVTRARAVASQQASIRNADLQIRTGPGLSVTAAGAVVAAIGAAVGATVGGGAPRIGLPERPGRDGPT